jgi:ABC-2 type transport system ATP-binding protein
VWAEIRRLNTELGMTIFLTTQYLDEADALAHRVGIITQGCLVAEGSPAELKRSIGHDVIVARVEGDDPAAMAKLGRLEGVDEVIADGGSIVVTTADGPSALSPVALLLGTTSLDVKSLTLRTPTLDDVFMELTGSSIEKHTA